MAYCLTVAWCKFWVPITFDAGSVVAMVRDCVSFGRCLRTISERVALVFRHKKSHLAVAF